MKPFHIDFMHRRPRQLANALVWLGGATVVVSGVFWWSWWQQESALRSELHTVELQLAKLREPVKQEPVSAPPVWMVEADALLRHDWNELHDLLEGIHLPGVRLLSVRAAAHPYAVHLEYQVESWPRVAELTEALQGDGSKGRWALQSVASGGASGMASSGGVRAVWEWTGH